MGVFGARCKLRIAISSDLKREKGAKVTKDAQGCRRTYVLIIPWMGGLWGGWVCPGVDGFHRLYGNSDTSKIYYHGVSYSDIALNH